MKEFTKINYQIDFIHNELKDFPQLTTTQPNKKINKDNVFGWLGVVFTGTIFLFTLNPLSLAVFCLGIYVMLSTR